MGVLPTPDGSLILRPTTLSQWTREGQGNQNPLQNWRSAMNNIISYIICNIYVSFISELTGHGVYTCLLA